MLTQKINEFYGLFLENEGTEFEVRFGTKGQHITKYQLDTTINKLKSNGFYVENTTYTLKIQPEFYDASSGRNKWSC